MYHPYKNGYSVLPQLKKIDNSKVFQAAMEDLDFFLDQKETACESQICFAEHEMEQKIYDDVCEFLVEQCPLQLEEPHTFDNIAMQIQDDLAIHRVTEDADWLAAAFICFPSMWRVEDKIGKSFNEIHSPVPKMALKDSDKMLRACIEKGPFERFVWSPVFNSHRINYHPRIPKDKFDKKAPCIHCKVERQVIVGFPEHNALLFTMRQFIIPEDELDLRAMYEAIDGMGMELEKYNGIFSDFFGIKDYLKEKAGIKIGFHTTSAATTKPPQQQQQQQRLCHLPQQQAGIMGPVPVSQGPPPFSQIQHLQNGKTMKDGKVVESGAPEPYNPDSYRDTLGDWSGLV